MKLPTLNEIKNAKYYFHLRSIDNFLRKIILEITKEDFFEYATKQTGTFLIKKVLIVQNV